VNILLADDQKLFAESLRTFLNNYASDVTVVGIASNGKEALDMAIAHKPDLVLMDMRMPDMDGVQAVLAIKARFPDMKIIMLSTYNEDAFVRSALKAGACGYLLKDISPTELITAIRALDSGVIQISPEIARQLVEERYRPPEEGPAMPLMDNKKLEWLKELTHREREIFTLLAIGYDNDTIAEKLSLAVQTVRNQVSAIYAKLGVKDRFEIIRLANHQHRDG
jgi:DNA-binding NarL/FixJ family response regulator